MRITLRQAVWRRRWLTADAFGCGRAASAIPPVACRRRCVHLPPSRAAHTTLVAQSPASSAPNSTPPNLVDVLSSRGFIFASTQSLGQLRKHFSTPRTLYAGFDPTAPSLHLGNLLVLLALSWAQHCGHRVIAVVGGGTGLVGDPTGRQQERQRMAEERLEANMRGIEASMRQILQPSALVVNNLDWLRGLSLLDFLRDVGAHYRIATLLGKASIQSRLASASATSAPSAGLSYTEFSYQLLQGYDWLQLLDRHACTVQLGGSDQWGNITSGMELINKLRPDAAVHGVTLPLLTTAAGEKFGKSAGNALWLDRQQTSPYALYQHMLHSHDSDVGRYMRLLTRLDIAEIQRVEQGGEGGLAARERLQLLAREVVRVVHGEEGVAEAEQHTAALWSGGGSNSQAAAQAAREKRRKSEVLGKSVVQLAVELKAVASKAECRRLIASGGLYLNGERIADDKRTLLADDMANGVLLLRVGKQQQHAIGIADG